MKTYILAIAIGHLIFLTQLNAAGWVNKPYVEARESFRTACDKLVKTSIATADSYLVPSQIDPDLTVDSCYIKADDQAEKLVILTSGIHGVEGHVGSALMEQFFADILPKIDRQNTAFLLIHSLNPFGQKYNRRVTENNVDLCRNFSLSNALFSTKNQSYAKFDDFLNHQKPVSSSVLSTVKTYTELAYYIAKYGVSDLRQSILGGQYTFPKGLYFGGFDHEPQNGFVRSLFERYGQDVDYILHADIHTGYGNRGQLHFFPNPIPDRLLSSFKTVFRGFELDIPEAGGDFYETSGDLSTFITNLFPQKNVISLAFEYGTNNNIETLGSIKSLQIMRLENQLHHFGGKSPEDKQAISDRFKDMYNPMDPDYHKKIMEHTKEVMPIIISNFQGLQTKKSM
ncbi:MAG: DUF2817 domain-containing protein [Pseudobacteriovorax sp.]|nr:DUF2817 domain-containing protein [Pseudobacteriovorax sp.]